MPAVASFTVLLAWTGLKVAFNSKTIAVLLQSWHTLPLKHVVESQQFDRAALDVIFSTGQQHMHISASNSASFRMGEYDEETLRVNQPHTQAWTLEGAGTMTAYYLCNGCNLARPHNPGPICRCADCSP